MTEIEKYLLSEIADQKKTANSASKRVGRKGKKKCTLPFEVMGKEERKKYMQASNVETFKMMPMRLKEFKKLDADKQNELLKWYGEKYGWNAAGVAAALDTSFTTATKLLEKFMLVPMFKTRMKLATDEQKREFIRNRKDIIFEKPAEEAAQELSSEGNTQTHSEDKMAYNEANSPADAVFEISMNKNELGTILARRLAGMANSLDLGAMYRVRLSIVQLAPDENQGVSNVTDA